MRVSTEILRRVYIEGEGVWLEVGPDGDGLDCVEIRTTGKSAEYFGTIRLTVEPDVAAELARALLAAATEASEARKKT